MISIFHYTELTVLQVSIIFISVVTCENTTDYDLPIIGDSNYSDYHSRPLDRYGQQKLDPNMFFKSIYNFTSRILPEPHSPPKYNLYADRFKEKDLYIDPSEISLEAKEHEEQSAIYEAEYNIASKYENSADNKQPLLAGGLNNVLQMMELVPKPYETKETFYKARVQLAKFLIDNTIPLLKIGKKEMTKLQQPVENLDYDTEFIELSTKDVYIKDEPYGQYVLRMVSLGKVPLDRETCQDLYQVQLPDENPHSIFWKLRLKLTTESLEKLAIETELEKKARAERLSKGTTGAGPSSSSSSWWSGNWNFGDLNVTYF